MKRLALAAAVLLVAACGTKSEEAAPATDSAAPAAVPAPAAADSTAPKADSAAADSAKKS
ncbi:MAG TPA: hypothetical protein VJ717_01710 [Gemmatimonadaceae bacterium]|nr:hypothetical protein [Gemmatimonadaceae bacterium]